MCVFRHSQDESVGDDPMCFFLSDRLNLKGTQTSSNNGIFFWAFVMGCAINYGSMKCLVVPGKVPGRKCEAIYGLALDLILDVLKMMFVFHDGNSTITGLPQADSCADLPFF